MRYPTLGLTLLSFILAPCWAESEFEKLFNGSDLSGWTEAIPGGFQVEEGSLVLRNPRNYPNWLRTEKEYENFVLRLEFMMEGWCESGVFLQAPEFGRLSRTGLKVHLRHNDHDEGTRSVGALFGVLAPSSRPILPRRQWNTLEIESDWPYLKVRLNGVLVHDINRNLVAGLRHRRRSGYIGLQDLGEVIHFRNLEVRELPVRESWRPLFNGVDFSGWKQRGTAHWEVQAGGRIVARDGDGYLITDEPLSSYEFETYVKTSPKTNGGIFFRWGADDSRGYEAQIYNVPDATNPTGSIYGIVPGENPELRDDEWFHMRIVSDGSYGSVWVNGYKVAESANLSIPDRGRIALQMHSRNGRIEFLRPRVKSLD
jgi:hypothetical protein